MTSPQTSPPAPPGPLDAASEAEARRLLAACLDAPGWVEPMLAGRPYGDRAATLARARELGERLTPRDVQQALARHPRIAERPGAGHDVGHSTAEQSGVDAADPGLTAALHAGNRAYEERFGRVFLIRAAGRSGPEILAELHRRLTSDDAVEQDEVREQLTQIALLRLERLLDGAAPDRGAPVSTISTVSTHVLDTSRGCPAVGVAVRLERVTDPAGPVGSGSTDDDGRVTALAGDGVDPGTYRLVVDTAAYFAGLGVQTFFPEVDVVFLVGPEGGHLHVPVLLSPFAYSTYRGS